MEKREAGAVFITGGARGIGKGTALYLLERGFRVAIADLDMEAGLAAEEELGKLGDMAFFHADVSDDGSIKKAIDEAASRFGGLDALINNAGIARPVKTGMEALTLEAWNEVISVNLTGAFLASRHAAKYLRKNNGSIVNIASTRAFQSEPGWEAYAASKGGLLSLTHAMALSLGPHVRVNCISPGWIHTGESTDLNKEDHAQHPAGRVGKAGDIASLVEYLISDKASFITGQNFVADGGMTKKMIYAE